MGRIGAWSWGSLKTNNRNRKMKTIELLSDTAKELIRLGDVRQTKCAAEREEKEIKKSILEVTGPTPAQLMFKKVLVGIISQGIWNGVDVDKLKKDFPKVFKACQISKPYPKIELAGAP